jgi:HAMP domain-containing protein
MTSPSKYTIQLLEGIHDDTQRHTLATDAARLLGTNAEQLEQLLARGVGARIARAGSEKRAEHVAGLLRSVGVNVEVVAPTEEIKSEETGNDFGSSTQNSEALTSAFEAAFEGNSLKANPFETPAFESASFESPALESNPFESPAFESNPFENPTFESNPFESASSQPEDPSFAQDVFAQASAEVEPAQAVSEEAGSTWWLPNAAQASHDDPFTTPTNSDPFGSAGSSDPFGSAGSSDPFVLAAADPFDSVIGAASTTSENETPVSSAVSDPFSTLLPGDDSNTWDNSNDQVSAPWLNSNALSSSAGTVPFEPVGASDPFAVAGIDPFASAIVEQYTPKSTSSDPFGSDPFASAGDADPFGPATNGDPFGTAGGSDPFGPASDTYSPTATTATVIRNDPFAAPMGAARDPFAPISDPFAAPSGDALAPVISLTSTSELPAQARAARDRAPRRSSIQTKTIVALIVPIILVVAGIVGFLSYQLPTTITTLLKARATAIAAVTAESLRPNFDRGDVSQSNIDSLSGLAEGSLLKVPYGAFFMIEHEARDIRQVATDEGLASAELIKYFKDRQKALDDGTDTGLGHGEIVNIGGTNYVAAAAPFTSTSMMGHGKAWVFAGLKMDPINEALRNTLVPIFVAIGITLLLALAIGTGLARSLLRPIIAATQQANRISLGDLDRTVPNTGNDEIGDLLVALEQMRVSLKSMVARLRRDRA